MSAVRATSRAATTSTSFICRSCRQRYNTEIYRRSFTTTHHVRAESEGLQSLSEALHNSAPLSRLTDGSSSSQKSFDSIGLGRSRIGKSAGAGSPMPSEIIAGMTSSKSSTSTSRTNTTSNNSSLFDSDLLDGFGLDSDVTAFPQPHRLHIYSHKHNTHITLVQPSKAASQTTGSGISATTTKAAEQNKMIDVLMSVSTGNIGFRKSGRGTYDAAYQLMGFVLRQIQERGLMRDIRQMEIALRGFGPGREAVTKALLGAEGRHLRGKVTAVFDATRLKQGGTRGKKPRRLG